MKSKVPVLPGEKWLILVDVVLLEVEVCFELV